MKPADSLGPVLLGLVPPIETHVVRGDDPYSHRARAKIEDQQQLRLKINEDFNYNMSQIKAVLPKPDANDFAPEVTLKNGRRDND